MQKSEQVSTFLVSKNQLPFFFLCAKYGPKVNTSSREYDKSSTVIPFRDIRSVSSTDDRELLNQNLSKRLKSKLAYCSNSFITESLDNLIHISYLQEPVVLICSGRKVQTHVMKSFLSPPQFSKVFGFSLVNRKDKMCTEENVAKTKALETAPIHEMKF